MNAGLDAIPTGSVGEKHDENGVVMSPASFRDPAGFVFTRDGILYRHVNEIYRKDYDLLISSGLYDALVQRGWLVRHDETEKSVSDLSAYKVLRPQEIEFISYPYEWAFSQLKAAALLVLDVQLLALQHGMTLKDASAYNVQFRELNPLLIDTLSFTRYEPDSPWLAYRQFCQHFLAPLALMAQTDIRLSQLLRIYIDGVPLDLASTLLPMRTLMRPGLAMHIHLHAKTQQAYASSSKPGLQKQPKVTRVGLNALLRGLRKLVAKLTWEPAGTEWAEYYAATNYSEAAHRHKRQLVEKHLAYAQPRHLWDLGANTGVFSRIASARCIDTIAFDVDPAAIEINYRNAVRDDARHLTPLLLDLSNPSPGLGWQNHERQALLSRGPVDCVMALALVHHLAIGNNVPLNKIAAFLGQICQFLIIEFVPKSDSQARRLLSSRDDIFDGYNQSGFDAAFGEYFDTIHTEIIRNTQRTLYLMSRKPPGQ